MRKLILVLGFLFLAIPVKANDVYLAQAGGGLGDGTSCVNARAASYFNSSGNWGTGSTQIGSGTTIHLCGSISTVLTAPTSSGTGTITIFFEPGAKLSQAAGTRWIVLDDRANSYVIDGGGAPCGNRPSGYVLCNGQILNTAMGSDLASQDPGNATVIGVSAAYLTGSLVIKNLELGPFYKHKGLVTLTGMTSNGTTSVTATCAVTCGYVAGMTGLEISLSSNAAYNIPNATVSSTSGTTMVLTYPTTIGAGSGGTAYASDSNPCPINVTCVNAYAANAFRANVTIQDNIIHDCSWCITPTADTLTPVGTTVSILRNDIYNMDHGIAFGTHTFTPTYKVYIQDNSFHGYDPWNTSTYNDYHHDGIHDFSDQDDKLEYIVSGNLFKGPFTGNTTAFVFMQNEPNRLKIVNNVLICDICTAAPGSMMDGVTGKDTLVANNTIIETGNPRGTDTPPAGFANGGTLKPIFNNGASYGLGCPGQPCHTYTTGNVSIMNNISTSGTTLMDSEGSVGYAANTATSGLDYNLYANYIVNGNAAFRCNTTTTSVFSAWQAACGGGSHSSLVADAKLDTAGKPTATSPAIGAGANLTSLCTGNLVVLCSDSSAGNTRTPVARSTTSPWDIGAYQSKAGGIDFGSGFSSTGMAFNGSAVLNGTHLRLTSGLQSQTGSGWFTTQVNVQTFTTDFTFQLISPNADGMTFAIQNSSLGAIGACGGGLAYGVATTCSSQPGIPTSVAVKFDLFSNQNEGINSTGLFTNGAYPTIPATTLGGGVDLHSGDVLRVHITYDGTTLTMTITDTVTNATFTTSWPINIPSTVGGNTAYVGFTGATGGQTATQDVITWTYSN